MKNDHLIGLWLGVAVLMGTSAEVSALTVGQIRGGAVLGQPLQLSVPVQVAADENISASCFNAEVWYGDSRQDSGRTSVSLDAGTGSQSAAVRVFSSAPISEPVVHVNLHAGCRDKITRRYTVLADAMTLPSAPVPAASVPAGGTASSVAAVSISGISKDSVSASQIPGAAPPVGASVPTAKPRIAKAWGAGASLKLTPSEVKTPAPSRATSQSAQVAQVEALEKRVVAVEEWKTQLSNPDGSPRGDERIKAIESDLKGLQTLAARNQQNVQILTQAVDKIQAERSDNGLLYTLGLLLAACVAALGFVLARLRGRIQQAMPWWRAGEPSVHNQAVRPTGGNARSLTPEPVTPPPAAKPSAPTHVPKTEAVPDGVNVDLDIDIPQQAAVPSAPVAPAVAPSAPDRGDKRDFQASVTSSLRAINTREMLDVRQQAEFFMALGQHDDAIKALESSIHASADSNPLVYLDLLRVLHTLSRKSEFDRYRSEFNHIFTGKVPAYTTFHDEGLGLEAYPDICRQIAELWPSDDAIDYIEQCMVRTPEDGEDDGFDMDAFRDLLMLHGMLRRMEDVTDSNLLPFIAARTSAPQGAPAPSSGALAGMSAPLPATPATAAQASAAPLLAATPEPEVPPLPVLQVPSAQSLEQAPQQIGVLEAGDPQADLAAASRDLNMEPGAEAAGSALDLELDLDLAAEEKPGNLIDFDISAGSEEVKGVSSKG